MTRPFFLRPEAQVDIEEAALWYEDQRSGLGDLFTTETFGLIQRIAEAPLQFPRVGQLVRRGLLERFPYSVYFIPDEHATVILAVLHQRRDPATWKRRVNP